MMAALAAVLEQGLNVFMKGGRSGFGAKRCGEKKCKCGGFVIEMLQERFEFGLVLAREDLEFAAEAMSAAVLRRIDAALLGRGAGAFLGVELVGANLCLC